MLRVVGGKRRDKKKEEGVGGGGGEISSSLLLSWFLLRWDGEGGERETEMLKDRSFSPRRKGRKGKGKKEGRIHHCNSETVLTGRRHRLTWLTA